MSLKALCVFAALMFALAVSASASLACDTGGAPAGTPTFSFTAPQQVYQAQAFVAAQPVVTQQFVQRHVVQQQFVAAPVQAFAVQQYAAPVVAVQAVRQPRRQVTRQVTTQRTGGLFGR